MTVIRSAFRVLSVLWAGSLWSVAAWVAPTLFYAQSDRHLAGILAAGLACFGAAFTCLAGIDLAGAFLAGLGLDEAALAACFFTGLVVFLEEDALVTFDFT